MSNWSIVLVSLLMLVAAVTLIISHLLTWRRFQATDMDEAEYDYRRRQFRRRMQTSTMLAVVAIAILAGEWLTGQIEGALFRLVYYGVVLILVLWITLLALADIWATKIHFGRLRQSFMAEQARLQAELKKVQARRRNGDSPRDDSPQT